jgi:glycosyltransferase involved in cell wall biosynthesis
MGRPRLKISIVTPTYNRRDLLKRLFESLVAQNYRDIEWIVIDDGGSDNTEEAVDEFKQNAAFEILYWRKENGGKDASANVGLGMATGDLVAVIDDDDYFLPNVFSQIADDFATIADNEAIAGLSYLTTDPSGEVWGKKFPRDRMISDHFDCRINQKIWGDKCEFTKGKALSNDHIRFCETGTRGGLGSDTIFLLEIAEKYGTCYINTPVLFKNYYENGISVNWRERTLQNPELAAVYYACYLNSRVRLDLRVRYMIAYLAIRSCAGHDLAPPEAHMSWKRVLFYLSYFPGLIIGSRWKSYKNGTYPQAKQWLRSKS